MEKDCAQEKVRAMVTAEAIAAMKAMALDPKKRFALAKDSTCIGGLVIVLSNTNQEIVKEALQTLLLLSECLEARLLLRNQVGMMDQLESIMYSSKKEETLSGLAGSLYTKLSETSDVSSNSLKDISNVSRNNSSVKNQSIHSHSKDSVKAKSIILQVKGFHDKGDRDLCARLLLKVKGVISITFDLSKKRCILRTKPDVKPETLTSALAKSMTMTAQQVIRNDKGEETFISFNTSQQFVLPDKENEELPDYLSDDSDTTIIDDKAVKRPTEEDKKKSAGWFSMATNFLTNSFYW
uniref:Armadillo repeat-containing protein 1 n=2 Tax=Biomphalaria glabrata TaxID=6526 RepID=A0A2C9L395_BIOGL